MNKRIFSFITAFVCGGMPLNAYADLPDTALPVENALYASSVGEPELSDLPEKISDLQSSDAETVCRALATMARICDQSCAPYIADALRHHEASVVKQAAKAAQALANPRLAPALEYVVWHHFDDDVRLEALRAMVGIADSALYRALLASLNLKKIDVIQRRILRGLPSALRWEFAEKYAEWAQDSSLVTSVVAAYRADALPLWEAIIKRISVQPMGEAVLQWLRALRFLAEGSDIAGRLNEENRMMAATVLGALPSSYDEEVARIFASLSIEESALWLLAHLSDMSPSMLFDVFRRIGGKCASEMTHSLLNAYAGDAADKEGMELRKVMASIIEHPVVFDAFISKIPPERATTHYALGMRLTESKDVARIESGLRLLSVFSEDARVRERVISKMGHSDRRVAEAAGVAASALAYRESLVSILETHPEDDNWGKRLMARYALIRMAHRSRGKAYFPAEKPIALSRAVLREPWRLHAEPAMLFLRSMGEKIPMIDATAYRKLRSEMKRGYLDSLELLVDKDGGDAAKGRRELLRRGLTDGDASVAASAMFAVARHSEECRWIASDSELMTRIGQYLNSQEERLSAHAIMMVAKCEWTQFIVPLTNRIVDSQQIVAYNALRALQELRALPDKHWLRTLYYRTPNGFLHDRLAFLAGVESVDGDGNMREFESHQILEKGECIQLRMQDIPLPNADVKIMLEDGFIGVFKTDMSGYLWVSG